MKSTTQLVKRWEQSMERRLPAHLPICIRLDGVSFKSLTSPLRKPFDLRFTAAMEQTAADLVRYFNATCAFTQSDEITLILPAVAMPRQSSSSSLSSSSSSSSSSSLSSLSSSATSTAGEINNDSILYSHLQDSNSGGKIAEIEHPYNGRSSKLISISSSLAAASFNQHLQAELSRRSTNSNDDENNNPGSTRLGFFDARCFSLHSAADALRILLWRQQYDGYRNTTNRIGQHFYGHRQCQGLNRQQLRDRLLADHKVQLLPPHDDPFSQSATTSSNNDNSGDSSSNSISGDLFISTSKDNYRLLNNRVAYGRMIKREIFTVEAHDPRNSATLSSQLTTARRTRITGRSFPLDRLPAAEMERLIFSKYWCE